MTEKEKDLLIGDLCARLPYEVTLSYRYSCISDYYKYCIPYNDDTKHLVGTKDEAPEYYRYWED